MTSRALSFFMNSQLWMNLFRPRNLFILAGLLTAGGIVYYSVRSPHDMVPPRGTDISEISQDAFAIPPPIARTTNETIMVELRATQVVAELADGTTYEYWTYNDRVPGPFIRAMEGDTVEVRLTHAEHGHSTNERPARHLSFFAEAFANGAHVDGAHTAHMKEGHGEHSIDLHSVLGPGGGAELMRVGPNESKAFQFRAMRPGLYIYHCASPHVPSHIANGMYGLILVEPHGGLPPVDREFYVVEGELYTTGAVGEKGHQELSKEKLLAEEPEYVVFNGRPKALTGELALRAKVGETVRIYVGAGGQLSSNFHIIGEIFDKLYPEGDIVSLPHRNVQTTLVPAGGAAMVEFTPEVPGKYLLVDHSLSRTIDRGALGELIVEGVPQPEIFKKVE